MSDKVKRIVKFIFALLGIMVLSIIAGLIVFVLISLGLTAIFGVIPYFINFIIGFIFGYSFTQLFLHVFKPEEIIWRD